MLPAIESLRTQIERIESKSRRAAAALPFGVPDMDARLPGGGLALGALHEVAGGGNGAVDGAAAALFTAGIVARTSGKVLWLMSRDAVRAQCIADALEYGALGVNDVVTHPPEVPLGGWKESGVGAEGGAEILQTYQRTKFLSLRP